MFYNSINTYHEKNIKWWMMNDILVIDLETTSPEVDTASIKVFGAYDPAADMYFIYKWGDIAMAKATELLQEYQTILTFNGKKYDIPILARHGMPTNFRHIDIYEIFKYKRAPLLGVFDSYSLKALILQLHLDENNKGVINYNIFRKNAWTNKEQDEIITYLKQDLLLEWKLWDYLIKRFEPLAKYLSSDDAARYKHITTSLPTYTYKIICKGANIQELYDEKPKKLVVPGGYTIPPRKLFLEGTIIRLQFTYLYIQTLIQFNLLSYDCRCCPMNEGRFHGRNYWNVKGYYCQKNHGRIERFLKKLYTDAQTIPELRTVFYVVYNNLYNVFTNAAYYSTYNPLASYDIMSMGRQQMKIVMSRLEEEGYYVAYVEGDDVFVTIDESRGQNITTLLGVKDDIIRFLKSKMPFPNDKFDLRVKDIIKYIQFFQMTNKSRNFHMKGQYVYITDHDRVYSKGVSNNTIKQVMEKVI